MPPGGRAGVKVEVAAPDVVVVLDGFTEPSVPPREVHRGAVGDGETVVRTLFLVMAGRQGGGRAAVEGRRRGPEGHHQERRGCERLHAGPEEAGGRGLVFVPNQLFAAFRVPPPAEPPSPSSWLPPTVAVLPTIRLLVTVMLAEVSSAKIPPPPSLTVEPALTPPAAELLVMVTSEMVVVPPSRCRRPSARRNCR